MKDHTIQYKGTNILFKNLHETGHNIDRFILDGSLFRRADHNFDFINSWINPGSTVYDIGAYIGSFAIPMHLEGMNVICFEGFPDNEKRLRENCNPYGIETRCVAVSDEEKTIVTKFNDCSNQEPVEREITYVMFDDYMKRCNLEKPDLVKIDIEGMETLALKCMTNLLENVRPVWSLGYHEGIDITFDGYPGWVTKENGGFDFDRFFELDYDVYDQTERKVDSFNGFGEYVCVPK